MAIARRTGNEFGAFVRDWTLQMKDFTKSVWQESMIMLVYRMQLPVTSGGRMPVRSGFLRASFRYGVSAIAVNSVARPGDGPFVWDQGDFNDFVRAQKVGTTIYMGYIAEYSDAIEYGFGAFAGYGFQRLAVQLWPSIVQTAVAKVKAQ